VIDGATWWRYFDRRVHDLKVLPIARHDTHIVTVPAWHQHPGLNRAVAQLETLHHGLAYRIRRRFSTPRTMDLAGRSRT